MKQCYKVTLHSQLGPREGTLYLDGSDSQLWGGLCLVGHENRVTGTRDGPDAFTLLHPLRTALGEHQCRSVFTLSGGNLTGIAHLENGCQMRWSGTLLPCAAEEDYRGQTH